MGSDVIRIAPAFALLVAGGLAAAQDIDPDRQRSLAHLVRHDCGSCHGLTLGGGLGPPLTAGALADKPDAALRATILHGRPGTPMPPWRGMLSELEVRWVVARLKSGTLP